MAHPFDINNPIGSSLYIIAEAGIVTFTITLTLTILLLFFGGVKIRTGRWLG